MRLSRPLAVALLLALVAAGSGSAALHSHPGGSGTIVRPSEVYQSKERTGDEGAFIPNQAGEFIPNQARSWLAAAAAVVHRSLASRLRRSRLCPSCCCFHERERQWQ